jgi:hypothetical protein
MGSTRWQRVSQTQQDVTFSNNDATVIGILGVPINQTNFPILGGIPVLDEQTGAFWNILSVLPISSIPSIPFSLITNPNTEPQFNYRFQGGV